MDEQILLEEMRAMREEMHAMREQMTNMIGDTNKKLEVIGGFVKAMNEAQTFEKTMRAVENVTKDITGGGRTEFVAIDGDRYFTTDGEQRNYYEPKDKDMLDLVMEDGNIFVDADLAVIPVQSNEGQPVGWVIAEKSGGFDGVDMSQLAKGSMVMDTISLAIERELNHRMAVTDELTHLKNRDGLNEYLKNTIVPAAGEDRPISILMCDIDHFKAVNDNYGHDAGDEVLKQVAAILSDNTRNGIDTAFRVGGEEMVCVLGCDTSQATDIAERIRGQIEGAMFMYQDTEIPVTVSIGVHEVQDKELTAEKIKESFGAEIKAADKALYEAKESGRNQVVVSEESREKQRKPTFYNKDIFPGLPNKSYITCDAKTAYEISQAAQSFNVEHSAKYYGQKSKVVVDGVKDREFLEYIAKSYPSVEISPDRSMQYKRIDRQAQQQAGQTYQPTYQSQTQQRSYGQSTYSQSYGDQQRPSQAKLPKYFNRQGYAGIENKIYVDTDSRTAYNISVAAQQEGVEHSVKYHGDRSTVTLDGVKDRHFLDVISSMAEWAAKVQIRAAQMREQQSRPIGEGAR